MHTPSEARTAALLDPHPLWLDAVGRIMESLGVHVVASASTPRDALPLLAEHRPRVLVTEIKMPDGEMDGVECLRRARQADPDLIGIVLSLYEDLEYVDAALEAGAKAYVFKTVHPDDFASAVRQAFDHSIYFAPTAGTAPVQAQPLQQ